MYSHTPEYGYYKDAGNKNARPGVTYIDLSSRSFRFVDAKNRHSCFENAVLPHIDAAFNLARWLTRNTSDAEDLVQEACLKAMTAIHSLRNQDGKSWLLAIVRNTYYSRVRKRRVEDSAVEYQEEQHAEECPGSDPGMQLLRAEAGQIIHQAIETLPEEFREVIILRELEEMSYREIAEITGTPVGTVMSRLARGRERLKHMLSERLGKESTNALQ